MTEKEHRYNHSMTATDTPKVGDGATIMGWTDMTPATVIHVSPSGKTVRLQIDKSQLSADWKPQILPGGFSGHCIYTYERDPAGAIMSVRLRKGGRWMVTNSSNRVKFGVRHKFYDYNF
jgi:hypothetical protein